MVPLQPLPNTCIYSIYLSIYLFIYLSIYIYISIFNANKFVCVYAHFSLAKMGCRHAKKNRASRSSFGKLYFRASKVTFLSKILEAQIQGGCLKFELPALFGKL